MKLSKTIGLLLVALVAFGGLIACGGSDEAAQKGSEQEIGPITYNSMNGDPEPRKFDQKVVAMFEEETGHEVEHNILAHEDFKQAIRTYLTSSNPPDLLTWFAGNRARYFIDKGLILDISDVWEEEGWNTSYSKGWQNMSTVDGKKYFLPTSWYWWAIYYRPSVFEKYGVSAPETWDEFMEVCETLKSNGVTPLTIGTKYRWTAAAWFDYLNMRINGPEFHVNLMLGKEAYNSEKVKNVFRKWAEVIDAGYFIDNPAAYAWAEAIPFMAQEEAAMYLMGDFIRDSFPKEILEKGDLDFFRFPIIDPSLPVGEDAPTDGYFIPAKAQNPEGGKALLAHFGSAKVQTIAAQDLNRLSTNGDVDKAIFNESQQKGIDMISSADFVAQFYDRDTTPEMADEGMNAMMDFWNNHSEADITRICDRLEEVRKSNFE